MRIFNGGEAAQRTQSGHHGGAVPATRIRREWAAQQPHFERSRETPGSQQLRLDRHLPVRATREQQTGRSEYTKETTRRGTLFQNGLGRPHPGQGGRAQTSDR